ncbi:Mediator complex subunit Med13 [Penicillium capsulatum]|uniref:Mediator of RNA polymerase II transcription subunit 13 n=1 Tax=Penicillium capsulatum TaxID=69766 RepID=A0A9W9ICH7_9EURO|nr:Mediator complex subunit Med13 [Penicillium capsulatum]KAJ6135176.1 Mediator complex subunit Med13 [Penicillium capsulatum]
MDFPGGAATNIHLIDGFSTIYWRIYTEEPGVANQPADGPANGYTILKHLSRLKSLEARLRNLNCLASCPRRLGLWVFSATPNFESLASLYLKEDGQESKKIVAESTTLKVLASGSVPAQELIKSLSSESQTSQANQSAGPQRTQPNQSSSRRPDSQSSSAAIYSSFISAVTGALNLHLTRSHGALPLGSRTLFTAVEQLGYESPRIENDSPLSIPSLTTLNVQLHASGTLAVSSHTLSQAGIKRLYSPQDDISDVLRTQPGTDIWLSPSGTIARLVTTNIESAAIHSPGLSTPGNISAKRKQWKQDVQQWLTNFGLHIDLVDEGPWVEVEVWEPFFARLAGEAWRQQDESQSALPLKRMLWPAKFCFRRSNASSHSSFTQASLEDPLEFFDSWPSETISQTLTDHVQDKREYEEPQQQDQETPSPRIENVEGLESLSRMAQYPELQTTNMVYPTPPDGATAIGSTAPNPPDVSPEDPDFKPSLAAPHDIKLQVDPKAAPNFAVGTGRYDASDDDDLFGEMNDRDFGSKGITDADFSFFDDPNFEEMGGDIPVDEVTPGETPGMKNPEYKPVENDIPASAKSEEPDTAFVADHGNMETIQPEPNDPEPAQIGEPMAVDMSPKSSPHRNSQTVSPPLSPVEIKKILFSGSRGDDHGPSQNGRTQQGHYHPVAFERKICDWDQKYGSAGKFSFAPGKKAPISSEGTPDSIPTIGLPRRDLTKSGVSMGTSPLALESRRRSSSVSSDESDDGADATPPEYIPIPEILPSLKRKRVPSESDIQSVTSAKPVGAPEGAGFKIDNSVFLGNFLANFSDWTFAGFFYAFQTQQLPVIVRREDQIAVAQLLADQITQSSLNHRLGGRVGLFGLEGEIFPLRACFENADFPGDFTRLDLKGYICLQDEMNLASAQSPKDATKGSLSKLSIPHLRVRRGKEFLEALPPAISFWETFGLEPASGPKDIAAYCIHPHQASQAADVFLDRFSLQYQSCNLGHHTRGDKSLAFEKGLRSWESEPSSYTSMMHTLREFGEELALDLSQSAKGTENCVVYIINPFTHAAALADICAAFWHLFQQLLADVDGQDPQQANEVVLQIIPMDFILSGESMVVPPQSDYLNLAFEVYSRCRPGDANTSPLVCPAPIFLANSLPKAINFRLAPEKASLLQDGRSLHIACSKSADQRWLSVAWSDGDGYLQTSTSYCLRHRSGGPTRAIAEVRNEIWTATKRIVERIPGRCKIVLVNSEPADSDEVETWANLVEQQNKIRPGSIEFHMVTVNTTPDLVLESLTSPMSTNVLNAHFSSPSASTPNPNMNIASPEQSGNAATPNAAYNALTPTEPSAEPDSEVVLTDIYDESWAVVLSHRLSSSPHVTEFRPALASGYLLRRKGTSDGDGVLSMAVNLIFSQRSSSSHDSILKDVLGMYRDLASLARARGLRSVQGNTLPWHIATALRSQELLSYVF